MSERTTPRRFLGRPEDRAPGIIPGAAGARPAGPVSRPRGGRLWLVQAVAGVALIVFLGAHLVAQHFLVPGGLRSYTDVVDYLRQPVALAAEMGLVLSVLVHAGLGLRSTLVDVIADPVWLRRASWAIGAVGLAIFVYAVWLNAVILAA